MISDIITQKGFETIYCDAKRMFILMDDKTHDDVKRLVEFINVSLPGIMEMQIESFYERALFLNDNSRVMLLENKLNIIGFDYFDKDFCFYAKNAQHNIFKLILHNNSVNQALAYVKKIIDNLRNHKVPVHDLIIYRILSRNLEEYTDKFPHVEVAKEMRAKNYVVGPGSVIKYAIVLGMGALHERAKIPSEVKRENIDSRFYIEHQLLPCVEDVFKLFNISREELLLSKGQAELDEFKK
jgi:DNA polymerase I